jgi:hypothetical protein
MRIRENCNVPPFSCDRQTKAEVRSTSSSAETHSWAAYANVMRHVASRVPCSDSAICCELETDRDVIATGTLWIGSRATGNRVDGLRASSELVSSTTSSVRRKAPPQALAGAGMSRFVPASQRTILPGDRGAGRADNAMALSAAVVEVWETSDY